MIAKKMALRKGSKVWVEDKDSAWVAAEVSDFIGKQVQLLTQYGKKVNLYFCGENFEFLVIFVGIFGNFEEFWGVFFVGIGVAGEAAS